MVQNIRGQIFGQEVTTKAVQPTSAKPIGGAVGDILRPLQEGKRGKQYVSPALLAAWPDIVGARLAGQCMPINMKAQPKSRSRHKKPGDDGAVLEVRADPSVMIDLDYGQALIVERINTALGHQAVARLKVLPKEPSAAAQSAKSPQTEIATPQPKHVQEAANLTANVADDDLRSILEKLGALVISAGKRNNG